MQVKTVQYGLGTKGHRSRMNGDWVSGPETLNAEQMGANRYDLGKTYFAHPLDDDYYKAMRAGLVEGEGAAALGRQLGRPAAASARQLRGLLPRRRRSRNGSRCTASSTGRITTPTMASACRRSSSAIS